MDPTPFFIMGSLAGTAATLLVQWYGRRKMRQATADYAPVALADEQIVVVAHLQDRITVLERLATEAHSTPARLDREIEKLR